MKRAAIEPAATNGVAIYAPRPATGKGGAVCTYHPCDSPGVAAWRARRTHPAGQAIYKPRAATAETIHADLKTWRRSGRLAGRGLAKCRGVARWAALAYHRMHFAQVVRVD